MFEVRNIAFTYRSEPVLRDVSFVVSPGEAVCVAGANGAGKTTLLKVLATLAVPDSGTVVVDGQNALARPLKYRRQLGYLPERVALYEDMTVKEYLHYRALLKGEMSKRIRRRIDEACETCRIAHLLRTPISSLSAGLAKRVAFADAILLRPRVLLLDDLLAGLDSEMRAGMGEIVSAAAAFSAVVVTGHEPRAEGRRDILDDNRRRRAARGGAREARRRAARRSPSEWRRQAGGEEGGR